MRARLGAVRLVAGPMVQLGEVTQKNAPKMVLVSTPRAGGAITTRNFIPHRCHRPIGVLAAVTDGIACLLAEGSAARMARVPPGSPKSLSIEHPTGEVTVIATLDAEGNVASARVLHTTRRLYDGEVFV